MRGLSDLPPSPRPLYCTLTAAGQHSPSALLGPRPAPTGHQGPEDKRLRPWLLWG